MILELLVFLTATAIAQTIEIPSNEVLSIRSYFYVGGGYADDGNGGDIFKDQMYVEKLSPPAPLQNQFTPIVLIHDQGQTCTNFLNKPDGGKSWTLQFLEAGYTVYIVDQTFRGRSAWAPGAGAARHQRILLNLFSGASPHRETIASGPKQSFTRTGRFIPNATYQQNTVQTAGAQLLDRTGTPVWLLGHSQGGLMPLLIAEARPKLAKGLNLLEPTGPPFQDAVFSSGAARPWGLTDIPMTYSPAVTDPLVDLVRQIYPPPSNSSTANNATVPCVLQAESPPPRHLPNLAPLPILTVTGEASYHAPYDYCTVTFLQQAGCTKAQHLELGKTGIHGNGHMMFMEKNSGDIWERLREWMEGDQ